MRCLESGLAFKAALVYLRLQQTAIMRDVW